MTKHFAALLRNLDCIDEAFNARPTLPCARTAALSSKGSQAAAAVAAAATARERWKSARTAIGSMWSNTTLEVILAISFSFFAVFLGRGALPLLSLHYV